MAREEKEFADSSSLEAVRSQQDKRRLENTRSEALDLVNSSKKSFVNLPSSAGNCSSPTEISPGFGELRGPAIDNKETILEEINLALGKKREEHPYIEYIITQPYGLITLPFGLGSINYNWFGHSALRYRNPDNGRDIVVNVEAKVDGKNFLQIYDAKEYFYGTNPETCGSQKGVYHRDYVTLRVEKIEEAQLRQMHQHILQLMQQDRKEARFNLFFGPLLNLLLWIDPSFPQYGNCARWTSTMLKEAGLVSRYFVWPKTVLINMFENYRRNAIRSRDNMHIVYYEQPQHVQKLSYGVKARPVWFERTVAPMQLFRNYFYGDFKRFANVIVRIPEQATRAEVIKIPEKDVAQPNPWRNLLNSKYYILSSVGISLLIYRRGWTRFRTIYSRWRNQKSQQ